MLKKDPEVTKRYGRRDAIAFGKPQTYNFSAHEKTQFPGKAKSALHIVLLLLVLLLFARLLTILPFLVLL